MNKLWLKITGIAVLALAAIIIVYALWPAKTAPIDESRDVEKLLEKDRADLEARPKPHDPEAEKLYQMALLHTPGNSPKPSYQIMVDSCRQIFRQYPDTAQAEKARELLRQYNMTDRQISRLYSSGPSVKKSNLHIIIGTNKNRRCYALLSKKCYAKKTLLLRRFKEGKSGL